MSQVEIAAARARAAAARTALSEDVARLKDRVRPAALANEAVKVVADRVSTRPTAMTAGGAVLIVALAVPKTRHGVLRIARLVWRNRIALGGLLALYRDTGPRPARRPDRKDLI